VSQKYAALEVPHCEFIAAQHLFFVGSAAADGLVNVSPKGMDSLRVLGAGRLVWLNLAGSGNETAAHVLELPRMTIMFCSFDKQPLILRIYGSAEVIYPDHPKWPELIRLFPEYTGARQIFDLQIELVQTSCGFAVPFYEFKAERDTLTKWADGRGAEGVETYWSEKNLLSLDGKKTGMVTQD
tara:strand:- start:1619 stop:2167 length:549 start_codon:yes stop_codon:yes gene_type:complete